MRILPSLVHSRKILNLALPVIAGLSTQMLLSLVDTGMVGRLPDSEYTLAAMGLGLLATWAIVSLCSSLSTGTHILVARRFGANDYDACRDVLFNSFILTGAVGIVIAILGWFLSETIAGLFAKDPKVAVYTAEYMKWRFLGLPFFMITVSYRGFFFGIGNVKVFMTSAIIVNLLNILFNYMFIYGEFGAPRMGLAGASIGSSLATVCDAIFYFIVSVSYSRYRKRFNIFSQLKLIPDIVRSILKLSVPVSFQNIFILIGFLSFVAITGLLSTEKQAASQAIISTLFISFLPCNGFGIAVQTLVGNHLGKGQINLAKIYGYETAKVASVYTIFLAIIYIFFPEAFLLITTNNPEIIREAVPAIRVAGFAQIFFASGLVFAYALQSTGKTVFVMGTEVITNLLIFVPVSYLLGIVVFKSLEGAWMALPVYTITYSIVMYSKFRFGDWKGMKKI
ncbi:MAG: MATE family efflux transporter [Ignavibacteriaceae bacterium]|nr:MATE family efflux transporter [Ignavibacteriaceae bacterium]